MNFESPQDVGKVVDQTNNHGVEREGKEGGSSKNPKSWTQVINNSSNKVEEANTQVDIMQDKEAKERQVKATNIIIKGVKDHGRNERTLDLVS